MLHTSESMLVPFGENDGDIDVDQMVDRYLRISYLIVDEMYAVIPELSTDSFWSVCHDDIVIPYTSGSTHLKPSGSITDLTENRPKGLPRRFSTLSGQASPRVQSPLNRKSLADQQYSNNSNK